MTKLLTTTAILLIATSAFAQDEVKPVDSPRTRLRSGFAVRDYVSKFPVERVIDGDTIVVTNPKGASLKVRLIGVDAPESQPNDKAKRDSERTGQDLETIIRLGKEATEFNREFLKKGEEVRLEFDVQGRDKYGRLLAYVWWQTHQGGNAEWVDKVDFFEVIKRGENLWINDVDIGNTPALEIEILLNAFIVDQGYASPMTIPPNVKYADLFQELYEEARDGNRGLWKDLERIDGLDDLRDEGILAY